MPLKYSRRFGAGCLLTLLMIPGLLGQEGKTVAITERLGNSVTLHTGVTGLQNDSVIVWTFGTSSPPPTIAKSVYGRIETNISERFRERLQLDPQTGSLSITNISTSDAGIYQLHIINGQILKREFTLEIYYPVNRPHITSLQASRRSSVHLSASGRCWVLCFVENGRDVTLSWYRGTERLNQTSSPDLSTSLSLRLEIWEDSPVYSCVATNPVSKEAAEGNIKQLCAELGRSQSRGSLMVCCCCWTLTQLLLSNNLLQMHRHRMQTIRDQSNNAVCSVSSPTSFIAALPLFLHSYLFIQLVAQKRTNAICPFSICTHSLLGHSDRVTDRGRASKHAELGVDKVQTTKPLRYTKYIKHKGK
nr:SLAM family member 9-like isoform X1 [Paramormyrops kingsleyae]